MKWYHWLILFLALALAGALAWLQMDTGVYDDASARIAVGFLVNSSNRIMIGKAANGGGLSVSLDAGGVANYATYTTSKKTVWFPVVLTWNHAANRCRIYVFGSQIILPGAYGEWAGAIPSNRMVIGDSNSSSPVLPWKGLAAHVAVCSRELDPLEAAKVSGVTVEASTGILAIGDSKTAGYYGSALGTYDIDTGWPRMLVDSMSTSTLLWVERPYRWATAGWKTSDVKAVIDARIATVTHAPDEILLALGANDTVTDAAQKATWKVDTDYIISALHTAFPSAKIRVSKHWARNHDATLMNQAIDELYASYAWLMPAINEANVIEGGDDGATYTTDGRHPNAAGYAALAAAWKAVIEA